MENMERTIENKENLDPEIWTFRNKDASQEQKAIPHSTLCFSEYTNSSGFSEQMGCQDPLSSMTHELMCEFLNMTDTLIKIEQGLEGNNMESSPKGNWHQEWQKSLDSSLGSEEEARKTSQFLSEMAKIARKESKLIRRKTRLLENQKCLNNRRLLALFAPETNEKTLMSLIEAFSMIIREQETQIAKLDCELAAEHYKEDMDSEENLIFPILPHHYFYRG